MSNIYTIKCQVTDFYYQQVLFKQASWNSIYDVTEMCWTVATLQTGTLEENTFYCTNKERYEGQPALEQYWYDIDGTTTPWEIKLAQRDSVAEELISVITRNRKK